MRHGRITGHEKVLYSRQERGNVSDRFDIRAASRTTNMIEDATQTPLSVAPGIGKHVGKDLTQAWHPVALVLRTMLLSSAHKG